MSQTYIGRNVEPDEAKYHHGRSPAAWVSVIIAAIAFVVGCVAVVQLNWTMLIVAGALLVVSLVVGGILNALGLGNAHS